MKRIFVDIGGGDRSRDPDNGLQQQHSWRAGDR